MIQVWADQQRAGALDRLTPIGSTFAYGSDADAARAVSITMPPRVQSYDWRSGLLPIFEMNAPEGALKDRLMRSFAKATGTFDAFDLLSLVGRSQLGRIRYSAMDEGLDEQTPFQSVDEILRARRDSGLFDHLMENFARYSGISGVQPKVLIRDDTKASANKTRRSSSIRAATHIVKMWDPDEFPELAANEYFCLLAARKSGLDVPPVTLSNSGDALVVDRFDIGEHGYLGLEDFCVLNAFGAESKYAGSYETRVFKRLREFLAPEDALGNLRALFHLFALNCAMRNGDAHLKNFALVYEEVTGAARLAPVYDLVTTTTYLPKDMMALTLDGSTRWPDAKHLIRLGQVRAELSGPAIAQIFESIADAMTDAWKEAQVYFRQCSEPDVGLRMRKAWEDGVASSLGLSRNLLASAKVKSPSSRKRPMAGSQATILAHLRTNGGGYTGTLNSLSRALEMPASTLSGALKTLSDKGFIIRQGVAITLKDREV